MGRVVEKLIVRNYVDVATKKRQVRQVEVDTIVDTGPTYVCLKREDIEKLGLLFHRTVSIQTANGKAERRMFRGAEIELNGCSFVMDVMEDDEGTPALIGYLLLEALDFVVDPKTQKVIPNPRHEGKWMVDLYSLSLIDYSPTIDDKL